MRLTAFDTYIMYLALRQHFERDSYDYFKFRGKVKATQDSFMNRRDRFYFQKLSRQHDESEMQDFLVCNILKGKKWIGDFLEEDAETNYLDYQRRVQSLSYTFANDLDTLFAHNGTKGAFKLSSNKQFPTVIEFMLDGSISPETFTILNKYISFSSVYDEKLGKDSFLWRDIRNVALKYHSFLEYDKTKLKNILKEKIKEYEHGEEQETSPEKESRSKEVA